MVFLIKGILMKSDLVPLIVGILVFLSSLISLRVGLSVAIIEILLGAVAGNLGLEPQDWMLYLASFGGIVLTFLAGTEIDTQLMKEKFRTSFLIGFSSFLLPFVGVFLYVRYVSLWNFHASLIAGTALSTTSLAVVYSVLVETNLSKTEIGKIIMASTFITDMGVALALSILFIKPTLYTLIFLVVSVVVIFFAAKFSHTVFDNPKLKNKVIEPEIKYLFLLLLVFMYFANLGEGHAVLPAFLLGLLMSKHFDETKETKVVRKLLTKFLGVYFLAKKYIPNGSMYTTLLMSTGLTFGTIASVFGLHSGFINQVQYSVLIGVVIASAVIPTFIAQKWFMPLHSEDLVELNSTPSPE